MRPRRSWPPHPAVEWIDTFVLDMNGHPRGKRLRRGDLVGIAKSGMMMPGSVFIMDPRGNCIAETGRLWSTGDPDFNFRILAGTLAAVPVDGGRFAQAVIVPEKDDPLDPRHVLAKQVARFKAKGHTPVAAVELEFYVTVPGPGGAFTLDAPPGVSRETDIPLTFQFEDMDALQAFNDDIYRIAEPQGLPVDALTQESGPSQFEINLKHTRRRRPGRARRTAAEAGRQGRRPRPWARRPPSWPSRITSGPAPACTFT